MTIVSSEIRKQFPIFEQQINGHNLSYLDSAASAQRPKSVIDAISSFYENDNANIHRAVHTLSQRATIAFENARETLRAFINAKSIKECIFVRGTTEAINLVSTCFERQELKEGDEIILTILEHHSNIVPWQIAAKQTGATIKVVNINVSGELILDDFEKHISSKTKMIAFNHVSNTLGTINPAKKIVEIAKAHNIPTLIDGAQATPHMKIDVQDIGCDFYTISSHKMYGPMGIGMLYGKEQWLEKLPPYHGGGDMIETVTFDNSTYNVLPHKFEAGTPPVADALGFSEAAKFLQSLDYSEIAKFEKKMLAYLENMLLSIKGVSIIGTSANKSPVSSFIVDGIHPHDLGTIADQHGVCIRTGHHCTMPLMEYYGIPATSRASIGLYNTTQDIDQLGNAIESAIRMFKK